VSCEPSFDAIGAWGNAIALQGNVLPTALSDSQNGISPPHEIGRRISMTLMH
jgi:hypothetical protein